MTPLRVHQSRILAGICITLLLLLAAGQQQHVARAATTFTVNFAGDGSDFSPGDGVCETAAGNGVCTLRAAIVEANAWSGDDTINFAIAPTGSIATISPVSAAGGAGALPVLTSNITIDGQTQNGGFVGIQLDGALCTDCPWGIGIAAGTSTIKGLIVNDFTVGAGIGIGGPLTSGNVIRENFIGTNTSGSAAKPNAAGVVIAASSGNSVGPYNTISGNSIYGVWITACSPPYVACGPTDGNQVLNNAIGPDGVAGCCTYAVPNGVGVQIEGASGVSTTGNKVGVAPLGGNTISGNTGAGVRIVGASGNAVETGAIGANGSGYGSIPNGGAGVEIDGAGSLAAAGNTVGCFTGCGISIGGNGGHGIYIHGALASGNSAAHATIGEYCHGDCFTTATALPNGGHGVYISGGAHDNIIGNYNDIAYNHGAGYAVDGGGLANQIFFSTIHDNDGLAIDNEPIAPFGTPQTPADFAPYITPAFDGALNSALYCPGCASGGTLTVTGYSRSAPPGTYHVDVYLDLTCDPSGFGEAERPIQGNWYVPAIALTTDPDGNLSGAGNVKDFVPTAGVATLADTVGKYVTSNGSLVAPAPGATTEYGRCLVVRMDSDSDGIEDSIDSNPLVGSPGTELEFAL